MRSRALFVSTFFAIAACDPPASFPDIEYVVLEANGDHPLTDRSLTTARAFFVQDLVGAVEDSVETPIEGGTFDLVVPVDSFSAPIRVRLELADASGVVLVGGTPTYYPAQSQRVGVLVGEPGSCDPVAGLAIGVARASAGVSLNGTFLMVSGGVGAGDAARVDVDAIDLLSYRQYHLVDAAAALGATRAAAIDANTSLVVPAAASPYVHRVYAASADTARPTIVLHPGANTAEAVLSVPGVGAVAIGGGDDASPANAMSWVLSAPIDQVANEVRIQPLHAAEPERSAAVAANGVWILSGGAGATTLEHAPDPSTAPVLRIADLGDGVRRGGLLVANPAGTDFLVLGGVDGSGVARTDTVAISGCPSACVAAAGPAWPNARTNIATDGSGYIAGGLLGGVPSAIVERVRFGAGGFVIEPFGQLTAARRDAGLLRLPTGSIYVLGGADASAPRGDVEICFAAP